MNVLKSRPALFAAGLGQTAVEMTPSLQQRPAPATEIGSTATEKRAEDKRGWLFRDTFTHPGGATQRDAPIPGRIPNEETGEAGLPQIQQMKSRKRFGPRIPCP